MDAMPITLAQELGGWHAQIDEGCARLISVMPRSLSLAQGGTAVGTGINAEPEFGGCSRTSAAATKLEFRPSRIISRRSPVRIRRLNCPAN